MNSFRWLIPLGAVSALAACAYAYQLQVTIVPGHLVSGESMKDVSIIIAKVPHQRDQLSNMITLPLGESDSLTTAICCTPTPDIWVYAFFDTNGSGRWDPEEPLAMGNNNPIRLTGNHAATLVMP